MTCKPQETTVIPSVLFREKLLAIADAVKIVQDGICKRVDINDRIKVYECQNVIRIDLKW